MLPSASIGAEGDPGLFEPVHGSAPKYAGIGRANPLAAILTVALMLDDLGHPEAAESVEQAVVEALGEGTVTADLGGSCTTSEVGDRLAEAVARPEAKLPG